MGEHGTGPLQSLHASQSFSRLDSSRPTLLNRSRARNSQNSSIPENTVSEGNALPEGQNAKTQSADIFDKSSDSATSPKSAAVYTTPLLAPEDFDELPIELISLTDRWVSTGLAFCNHLLIRVKLSNRFIESLSARVYNTPPSIDRLSELFQEFYTKAGSHISTHISALSSRQYRDAPASSLIQLKGSQPVREARRLRSSPSKDTLDKAAPEQQMLTPQEISDRRKARRLLEQKGIALEEAVEKRVCERVYERIWRHRSTLDEVRDEKLRSRTAALALVGIGLGDLGIKFDKTDSKSKEMIDVEVENWISKAREGLLKMNDTKYPVGKLQHLAATHKSIVNLLTSLHQSSSSADEILPTLIYTLITTPPEGINVISNLHFTQRFRAASKIDGEMAYCLTNLEAAISFLETVDLASLRSDEPLEGPPKSSSRPSTPRDESYSSWSVGTPSRYGDSLEGSNVTAAITSDQSEPITIFHPPESLENTKILSPAHSGRLSQIFQPPTNALGAASDAVRNTADQGLKGIGNTLDNSLKFLFGRLMEQHIHGNETDAERGGILPRTLDDARKLVDPKSVLDEEGDASGASSIAEHTGISVESPMKLDDRILGLFAGHRDRSADSAQSSGSGKRVAMAAETAKAKEKSTPPKPALAIGSIPSLSPSIQHDHTHTGNVAIESMRNLGNTLNPLNRFAGMNVMRGFGRNSSAASLVISTPPAAPEKPFLETSSSSNKDGGAPQISPPIQRFMSVADASDLKIGEVEELLRDYKRLAGALQDSRAF